MLFFSLPPLPSSPHCPPFPKVVRWSSEPVRQQLFDRLVRPPPAGPPTAAVAAAASGGAPPAGDGAGPLIALLGIALGPDLKGAVLRVLGAFASSTPLALRVRPSDGAYMCGRASAGGSVSSLRTGT